jgi:hypothetical protein
LQQGGQSLVVAGERPVLVITGGAAGVPRLARVHVDADEDVGLSQVGAHVAGRDIVEVAPHGEQGAADFAGMSLVTVVSWMRETTTRWPWARRMAIASSSMARFTVDSLTAAPPSTKRPAQPFYSAKIRDHRHIA